MSELKTVESFQTPDGTLHTTREAALAHMNKDKYLDRAKAFVESKGQWPRGQDTRATNLIAEFLAFEEVR